MGEKSTHLFVKVKGKRIKAQGPRSRGVEVSRVKTLKDYI
jgi:hypothetical protein